MNTKEYFQEIGAWPRESGHLARMYVVGFLLSLALTFIAYFTVVYSVFSPQTLLVALLLLACVQFAVQIICFLHLGKETSSRERLIVFGCAILIVLIIVSGSLWIMFNLNQRMTPDPAQMEQYMNDQEGI